MIARLLTHLTAAWDRLVEACDVDRQVCRFPQETHEPLDGEDA